MYVVASLYILCLDFIIEVIYCFDLNLHDNG